MTPAPLPEPPVSRAELKAMVRQVVREVLGESDAPGWLGISQVERRVRKDRSTIYRLYMAAQFPRPEYRGNARVWSVDAIEAWEREQAARPRKIRLRGIAAQRAKVGGGTP